MSGTVHAVTVSPGDDVADVAVGCVAAAAYLAHAVDATIAALFLHIPLHSFLFYVISLCISIGILVMRSIEPLRHIDFYIFKMIKFDISE